jgi:hypothetical protein
MRGPGVSSHPVRRRCRRSVQHGRKDMVGSRVGADVGPRAGRRRHVCRCLRCSESVAAAPRPGRRNSARTRRRLRRGTGQGCAGGLCHRPGGRNDVPGGARRRCARPDRAWCVSGGAAGQNRQGVVIGACARRRGRDRCRSSSSVCLLWLDCCRVRGRRARRRRGRGLARRCRNGRGSRRRRCRSGARGHWHGRGCGGGLGGGRRRARRRRATCRQEAERIEVALRLRGDPDAEMDVDPRHLGLAGAPGQRD